MNDSESISVLQITDTHLGAGYGATLLGMDTDDSLLAVLDLVRHNHSSHDYLLATGDIALRGEAGAYRRFIEYAEGLAAHSVWIPGNHDDPAQMNAVSPEWMQRRIDVGAWQIILLDSTVPGEVGGELGAENLQFLEDCLRQHPQQAALICLHHHALPVCSDWLDGQTIRDSAALLELLARFEQPRVVLGGHVHQEQDYVHEGIRILSTPSTCVQFKPNSEDFGLDDRNPGYRWLKLKPGGEIETGVERVADRTFNVDRDSRGY